MSGRRSTLYIIGLGFVSFSLQAVPIFPLGLVLGYYRLRKATRSLSPSLREIFAEHRAACVGILLTTACCFLGLGVGLDLSSTEAGAAPALNLTLSAGSASAGLIAPTRSIVTVIEQELKLRREANQPRWLLHSFRACRETIDGQEVLEMSYNPNCRPPPLILSCTCLRIPRGTQLELDDYEHPSSGPAAGKISADAHATVEGKQETIRFPKSSPARFNWFFSQRPVDEVLQSIPQPARASIEQNRVAPGMSLDELYLAWGYPDPNGSQSKGDDGKTKLLEYWDLGDGIQAALIDNERHTVEQVLGADEYRAGEQTATFLRNRFATATFEFAMTADGVSYYASPKHGEAEVDAAEVLRTAVAQYRGTRPRIFISTTPRSERPQTISAPSLAAQDHPH